MQVGRSPNMTRWNVDANASMSCKARGSMLCSRRVVPATKYMNACGLEVLLACCFNLQTCQIVVGQRLCDDAMSHSEET